MPLMPNESTDHLDPEPGPAPSPWSRWIGRLLTVSLLLLLFTWPSRDWHTFGGVLAAVCYLLLILRSILARQRALQLLVPAICLFFGLSIVQPAPRGRSACPECAAVANLRTIDTAEVTYLSSSNGRYGMMTDLIDVKLLDDSFMGTKAGYKYSIVVDATGSKYTAFALPISKKHGRYGYFSGTDAVVRYLDRSSPECTPCFPEGHAGGIVR